MTQPPQQGGASVLARGRVPSTDLASLIAFLVEAFPPHEDRPDSAMSWPVLTFAQDKRRLELNTAGIILRLLAQKKMRAAFHQSEESGFLRDLVSPPKNFTAKMGGRVYNDNLGGISQHVTQLKRLISDQLDLLGVSAGHILVPDPEAALQQLAQKTGIKDFLRELPAKLVAIEFAKSDRSASPQEHDVARVFSAREEIQAEDWLERMANSIAKAQSLRDDEFDEAQQDRLVETLRQDFVKNDSQVTRFLNFLEDEALARVRLTVSFAIMQGLAIQIAKSPQASDRSFVDYVQRVVDLFKLYGAPESEHSLHLDLSHVYGLHGDFSVSAELVKALFYNCLPVWAEWNTQLFESRSVDPSSHGVSVVRDVSYRFRVNGKDPRNEMLHAFDSRLSRLRKALIDNVEDSLSPLRLRRNLAEAMFLWLVLNPALDTSNLEAEARALAANLNAQGRVGVDAMLKDLSAWSTTIKGLSKTLVNLLRTKSPTVIAHAQRSIDDLYLVVQEGVVDWSAIERSRGKARDPLIKPPEGRAENVEWFKHIKVARKPDEVVYPLFSVRVRTLLHERKLVMRYDGTSNIQMCRQLPGELLNIIWKPIRVDKTQEGAKREARTTIDPVWRMGAGVDIWYEPEQLKQRGNPNFQEADRHQYRAAAATALTILVYVFLQVVSEKLAKERGERASALMLRFQTQGKKASEKEGDHLIYAASQAIESALMRDMPVRMQGLVTEEGTLYYKEKGAAFALSGAFPLIIGTNAKPMINKIAVLVYTTRPCDDHPNMDDTAGFVFQAKTYLAEAVIEPFGGYRLSFDRMQSHVVETQDEFKSPKLIVEEVSRLYGQGCEHVMLISNHFGNRRINRSAQRHSPHTQTTFLNEVATKFANVNLYTLRRDVFPATRLHNRTRSESAFEAVRLSDHNEFAIKQGEGVLKQLRPVFTFATLAIVGKDDAARPQSGFCTYFWDDDYQVRNIEWRERVRANIMGSTAGGRECLLDVLRGLHFLEAEKQPDGGSFKPVLDPFGWVQPATTGGAGEIEVVPASRRKGGIQLSLPALLSHVTAALHRGRS